MSDQAEVRASIIIPSHNRPCQARAALEALARQTYPQHLVEVVLVDDGSQESYQEILPAAWPFAFRYCRQQNGGEAVARAHGVELSQGDLLLFLDDDILVEPRYVAALVAEHRAYPKAILNGLLLTRVPEQASPFAHYAGTATTRDLASGEIRFTDYRGAVMAVPRAVYAAAGGMLPDPGESHGGWCDMDFAYRAHKAGFAARRCAGAVAFHDDYALRDLATHCQRTYTAARLAVLHFQRHPGIQAFVPMFDDKTPVAWRRDPPRLVARKIARRLLSARVPIYLMEKTIRTLERLRPDPMFLHPLYRWTIGGYVFRGYRSGLRAYGAPGETG